MPNWSHTGKTRLSSDPQHTTVPQGVLTWTYCTQAVLDPPVVEDVKFPILKNTKHNMEAWRNI